jgi:gamma-glutamyltranspeptidase/glutathione hydrolase
MSVGVGGGGFMLYYDAEEDDVSAIDFYQRAPEAVTPELWIGDDGEPLPYEEQASSGKAVAVPGGAKGLERAHELFGSTSWEQLISPTVDLARGGVVVDRELAEAISENWDRLNDAAKEVFSGTDDDPLEEGDLLVQEDLANTLQLISEEGSAGLYEGEIAEAFADVVQQNGGEMTTDDLREYEAQQVEPIRNEYRGLELFNHPLPTTSGFLVPRILQQLERFDLGKNYGVQSWEKHHLFVESTRLAWADRAKYLGDPEFVDVPIEGLQDNSFVEERGAQIELNSTLADYDEGECAEPGNPYEYQSGNNRYTEHNGTPAGGKETTHFTVADAEGNVVVVTASINSGMGSGIMVPGHGFMLNNYLVLFDDEPGGPNQPNGGKAPISSTSPTLIMKDGSPYFTSGSPGGTTIPQTAAQVILNVVEYDMDIADAVIEPRITTNECPPIGWEEGIPDEARNQAADLGHVWEDEPGEIGSANNLPVRNDRYFGGADPRRESVAIGLSDLAE